jgi:nitrogenase molybdenum-iron protein NifN
LPPIVPVSTPAYSGSHEDGYHLAIGALVNAFASKGGAVGNVVALPPLLSPEDVRWIKSAIEAVALRAVVLPDYSLTLDGESWEEFSAIPPGGVSLDELGSIGLARAALEFGAGTVLRPAGKLLRDKHGVSVTRLRVPTGIKATDAFFASLTRLSGLPLPAAFAVERGRLLDAYADGNKYVYGKRVAIFGDEDCVAALMLFCAEIGMKPVVAATGRKADRLREELRASDGDRMLDEVTVCEDTDFDTIEGFLEGKDIDLCIGTSKGYRVARARGIPLVRVGFPVHDRFGAARMATCGYRGTLEFYDRIVNTLLEAAQESSNVGYSYL